MLPAEKVRYEYIAMYCQEISFADGNINAKRLTNSCDIDELRCHLTSSFSKWHLVVKFPETWQGLIYFFFSMLDDHHWHTGMSSANDDDVRGREAISKSSTGEIATVCIMKRFSTIRVAKHINGTQWGWISPSFEILKTQKVPSKPALMCWAKSWTRWPLEVPSNSYKSVTL